MNTNEFKNWLEGFLEGRDALSEIELEILKDKLSKVYTTSHTKYIPYPTNPITTPEVIPYTQPYAKTQQNADEVKIFTQTTTNDKIE